MALQPLTYRVDDHNFTGYLADGSAGHPVPGIHTNALVAQLRSDPRTLDARVAAACELLKAQPHVDPARIAAVGFCFGGHSFTNREIDAWHIPGFAYHAAADRRSWRAMSDLLREVFDTSIHTTEPAEGKCEN